MHFVFPTTDLQQIKISFAAESDGAANLLIFDYWDGTNWVNTGISNPTSAIGVGYSLIEVNLSQVILANNQAEFKFRIRFDGDNMFLSEGKRVQFNNIAIESQQILSVQNIADDLKFTAFPNPASKVVNIKSSKTITDLEIYNLYGQMVRKLSPNASLFKVEIQDLPQGIYLLKTKSERQKEKVIKIIKN